MGIESKRVRKWLAALSLQSASNSAEASAEPPSYIASFNPFPALVIGVTGAAMSAHAQAYVFQVCLSFFASHLAGSLTTLKVQIHALWGYLLVGFAILRSLTYCFLWLGPPRSLLPSRPPTEALGSFFLACGGLMFIFSTEELTFAAMRQGRDGQLISQTTSSMILKMSLRYDVLPKRGCFLNMLRVLLDILCCGFQGVAQITHDAPAILSQLCMTYGEQIFTLKP